MITPRPLGRLAFGVALAIGLTACNLPPESSATANGGSSVDPSAMKTGQELIVELAGNATTGYQWKIQPGTDSAVIELASSEYRSENAAGKVGAGGTRVFRFRAAGVGRTHISIHYLRPWESQPPAREYAQTVTVIE